MKSRNVILVMVVLLLAGFSSDVRAVDVTSQGGPFMTNTAGFEDTGRFARWDGENLYPNLVDGDNVTTADTWGEHRLYDSVGLQFTSGIIGVQQFEWDMKDYGDGGWFNSVNEPVLLQVTTDPAFGSVALSPGDETYVDDNIWITIPHTHDYPLNVLSDGGGNATVPANGTTFTFAMDFPGIIYGIRIVGDGGGDAGNAGFLAAQEIRVFTGDMTVRATAVAPTAGQIGIETATALLQWTPAQEGGVTNPNVVGHYVYLGTDPNGVLVSGVTALPVGTTSFVPTLVKDTDYYWHVDELMVNGSVLKGWSYAFQTELTFPLLNIDLPADEIVDPNRSPSVTFTVEAENPFYPSGTLAGPTDGVGYQWQSDNGTGFADLTGEISASLALSIVWGDGQDIAYQCVVSITDDGTGASGNSINSKTATLTYVGMNLLAHWKMDDDTTDSANGYDGIATGGPLYEAGKLDNAIILDGVDDYVTVPSGFDDFTTGMTLSVWAKPTTNGLWARFFDFANGEGNDNILFCRRSTSDDLAFEIYLGGEFGGGLYADGVLELNVWQMLTATIDASGNAKLYKNGAEVAAGVIPVPNLVVRTSNLIGKSNWLADPLYVGSMDDVRVYNYALSTTEVADMYLLPPDIDNVCLVRPVYDFDGDCIMGLGDFAQMASSWLECNLIPVSACD